MRARVGIPARPGLALGALALAGCAPVFSDFQSARLVGIHRVEVTPSYSYVSTSGDHVQDEYGIQVATGVADRVDLRARYVRVQGVNVVGLGPKVSLVRDKVALAAPVGLGFGEGVDSGQTWAVHPTLLLTAPVDRRVELNASSKLLVPLSGGDRDTLVAFNVGVGLGDLERWAIRPEVGVLLNPGDSGHYTQFGIGLTLFGGSTKAR